MSQFTVTLGSRPELTPVEKQQRARRAREVLDGAGWAFDEFISDETRALLDSDVPAERESHHQLIRAATEMKGRLIRIVETQAAEEKHASRNRHDDE